MVKVMEDDPMFKKGAYKGQQSDGLYMDGVLVELTHIFARKIVDDNQFFGQLCSSTFGVRTGKSTLAQQMGYYYTYMVNKLHGLDLTFDHTNIVFNIEDLEKRAYKLKRYSCLILDESEGLDEHVFSKKIKKLQAFLRTSGQLNLYILAINPSFFSNPQFLAMNRTNFLIDVKFEGEFERGYFSYYNFTDKKKLYVKGKKHHDYSVQKATLQNGRFVPMYCVDEEKYREMKLLDLKKSEESEDETVKISPKVKRIIMRDVIGRIYPYFRNKYDTTMKDIAEVLGMHRQTVNRIYAEFREEHGIPPAKGGKITEITVTPSPKVSVSLNTNDTISLIDEVEGQGEDSKAEENLDSDDSQPLGSHSNI